MHFNTLFFKAYVTLNYKLNTYLRLRLIIVWKRSRCAERKKSNPKKQNLHVQPQELAFRDGLSLNELLGLISELCDGSVMILCYMFLALHY